MSDCEISDQFESLSESEECEDVSNYTITSRNNENKGATTGKQSFMESSFLKLAEFLCNDSALQDYLKNPERHETREGDDNRGKTEILCTDRSSKCDIKNVLTSNSLKEGINEDLEFFNSADPCQSSSSVLKECLRSNKGLRAYLRKSSGCDTNENLDCYSNEESEEEENHCAIQNIKKDNDNEQFMEDHDASDFGTRVLSKKRRDYVRKGEKKMLLYQLQQISSENPGSTREDVVVAVSRITGITLAAIHRVIEQHKKCNNFLPKKIKRRNRFKIVPNIDEYTRTAIGIKVNQFFAQNELPTIDKVLENVNADKSLPMFKRTTFFKLLKDMNFKFEKRNKKSILIEKDDIVKWRRRYLRQIKNYRQEGRTIYYLYETLLSSGHTKQNMWKHKGIQSPEKEFQGELSTSLKSPPGKGKRFRILHIGSDKGFVEDGLLVFESYKLADNHDDVNGAAFESWFKDVLPKLEDNCIIVMDNASYHSIKAYTVPTAIWSKDKIIEWLQSKDVVCDSMYSKRELLELVANLKPSCEAFIVGQTKSHDKKVILRLPPYHCELNPMELVWSQVKDSYTASKITSFKLENVQKLVHNAVQKITEKKWTNFIKHVTEKVEPKMWQLDSIIEKTI